MSLSSVTAAARRAAATKRPDGGPRAKRGDLVVVEGSTSSTALHGPTTRTATYTVGRVASVARDGMVSGIVSPPSRAVTDPRAAAPRWWLVAAKDLPAGVSPDAVLAALGDDTRHPTIDAARDRLREIILRLAGRAGR